MSFRSKLGFAALLAFGLSSGTIAGQFDALTSLAQGAVAGTNVGSAVDGFELLVLQGGQSIYHQSFGAWTQGQNAGIDSSTKTISGALMMSVTDTHGNFTLDTKLSTLLPSFQAAADKRDITVRQAFSHTSGLPSDEVGSNSIRDALSLQAAADLISTQTMSSLPGGTFAYGALSMQAAGAAAEMATGQTFSSLLNDRILNPLGMNRTGFVVPSATSLNPRVAGGLSSTAADYGSFMDMLLNKGDARNGTHVLSAGAVATMLSRQATDGDTHQDYGIGVWLGQGGVADVLAGGARGFHSWIDVEHDLVFVFSTDKSSIENVMPLSIQMHQAILQAVAVPEPRTYAMLLLGLGLVAGVARLSTKRQ